MREIIPQIKSRIKPYIPDPMLTGYRKIRKKQDLWRFQHHLRGSDLFLVGHPKSGNTWMAYMLAIILYKNNQQCVTLANIGDYIPVVHGCDSEIALYSKIPEPRIFRNETPRYPDLYPKTIYLVRDPRAVLVSYYHMYIILSNDKNTTLEAFVEEYLSQGCIRRWEIMPRWDEQVLTWTKRGEYDDRVLIVKYEDMVSNRRAVLERVTQYAKMPCEEEYLNLAEVRGSFEAMRMIEQKHGAESYLRLGERRKKSKFIRRGKIEGWKEEMPQSVVYQIEKEFASVMKAIGYLS